MPNKKELLLGDFRNDFERYKDLCGKLDIGDNWKYLLDALKEHRFLPNDKTYNHYEKFKYGGGSCALIFLNSLCAQKSIDELALKDFRDVAKKLQRYDVIENYLDKLSSQYKTLRDLKTHEFDELSTYLDNEMYGFLNCWKEFANHYGYKYEAIQRIESQKDIPKQFSPTQMMLDDSIRYKTDFFLSQFYKIIKDHLNRCDIMKIIEDFEKNVELKEQETVNATNVNQLSVQESGEVSIQSVAIADFSSVHENDSIGDFETTENDFIGETETIENDSIGETETIENDSIGDLETIENDFIGETETMGNDFIGETETVEKVSIGETETMEKDSIGEMENMVEECSGGKETFGDDSVGGEVSSNAVSNLAYALITDHARSDSIDDNSSAASPAVQTKKKKNCNKCSIS